MAEARAGVSALALDLPLGIPMLGYGARAGPANAHHDALFARALYLRAGGEVLIVECDLCLLAPVQAREVRRRVAQRTRVPAESVLVGCTHTHSGPDTGLGALLRGGAAPHWVEPLLGRAVEAACRAHATASPARLGLGRASAQIGRNRRRASGPVDPEVGLVRVDRDDGTPLALLFLHGCHPTVLGHDNLAWSADWPGAAIRGLEAGLPGATALFALSAHADVDPRTRGLQDLAVPDRSRGASFAQMEMLGLELAEAALEAAHAIRTRSDVRVDAAATELEIPVHGGELPEAAWQEALECRRRAAFEALGVDPKLRLRTAELLGLERELARDLPPDEARRRIACVRLYLRDRQAPRFAGSRTPRVEAQLLRIDEALLLALPLEPTVEVGLDWKRRAAAPLAAVIGIANGWLRYLPHARAFAEPDAELGYEVLSSTLVPEASTRLLEAGQALRERLEAAAPT